MSRKANLLSDAQWKKIFPLLPSVEIPRKKGRPRADDRMVVEGILWVLRTGARWKDLPDKYPSPSTCWRRLKGWEEDGIWLNVWRTFLSELDSSGVLDWSEAFMDGSFAPAKKGRGRRKNQEGQRNKVDGGGRWSRYSTGKPYRLCLAR